MKRLSTIEVRELPMFMLGIFLLLILLMGSFNYPSLQYNIIWMVTTSLNVAIIMAFLPFAGEFNIPGWAKFSGSAAVLMASIYLTFGIAKTNLVQENDRLREQVDTLGKRLSAITLPPPAPQAPPPSTPKPDEISQSAKTVVIENLAQATTYMNTAQQYAWAATTNTSDVRGCVQRSSQARDASNTAITFLNIASKAIDPEKKP